MSTERATIDELRKILQYYSKGYKVPDIIKDTLYKVAKTEVEDKKKVVLLKRDPNIDRNRIQASLVKIIDGETLAMHPATVGGYGADFDGDQMAIYAPISEESQKECFEKMITAVSPSYTNSPQFNITKESLTGIFTLTYRQNKGKEPVKISSIEEAEKLDIGDPVIYKDKETTAGRVIFSSLIPQYIKYLNDPYPVNGKALSKIFSEIINTSKSDYVKAVDTVMKAGFKYSTIYPSTIALDMLRQTTEMKKLKEDLSNEKDLAKQQKILDSMESEMMRNFKENYPSMYENIESGAAKGKGQIRQCVVAKGLIRDAQGNVLEPVVKAINEGFNPEEYFHAAAGSRKGIIDRAVNTASGGYAYRKSIYAVGNIEADINNGNCGTRKTMRIKLTSELFSRMKGRYVQDEKGNIKPIDASMIGTFINLRSPIYCKTEKICRTCYGDLIKQLDSKHVGIIAAMQCLSLSEKIMKCAAGLVEKDNKLYAMEDLWSIN